jgi:hypothetical protein
LLPPVVFLANDVKQAFRIPHCERADVVVAALMFPQEAFAFMRAGWFTLSWIKVLGDKVFGLSYANPWTRQAHAETGRRAKLQPEMKRELAIPAAKADWEALELSMRQSVSLL